MAFTIKHSAVFLLFAVTGATCIAQKSAIKDLPALAKTGRGGYLKGELIYPLDNKPTPQCHASTIAETPSGLVVAFFAGTHERNADVGIRVSRLEQGKWTRPVEVVNGIQGDSLRYPCWNPVLFTPRNGPLMLFYKVGPNPRAWWGMLITSTDDGKTWGAPARLGESKQTGQLIGPVKNKPVQLPDGAILCPSSTESMVGNDTKWKVHYELTKDMGKTWEVIGPVNDGIEFDAIQPSILTYAGGRMQSLSRTAQNVVAQNWSEDGGRTWSKMTATTLPNPNSGTDAVTLKDGRQLIVYNHTTQIGPEPKGRNMLNVALSTDGHIWKPVLTLENQPVRDGYAYPAVIQSKNGMVHITYTYDRQSVKYVLLDPGKL